MSWTDSKARKRIDKFINDVPSVNVRRFSDEYLPNYRRNRDLLKASDEPVSPPLFKLPRGSAVMVDTVQIYIQLVNYDEFRLADGRETEVSHARALSFLHLYYSACDRVAELTEAQRIDFHGARMHAVVLETGDAGVSADTLARAFQFIDEFRSVAAEANRALASDELSARFRIGVDIGRCVAINNGSGSEQEPMFLGSAANHAAKLADGHEPGVFVSRNVKSLLSLAPVDPSRPLDDEFLATVAKSVANEVAGDEGMAFAFRDSIINRWKSDIADGKGFDPTRPDFVFRHKTPPLSELDFAEISPSRSIRMPVLSAYADLDGFTTYIDQCIDANSVNDAVRALFVIRRELQAVVEDDFGGKKIRFVGDCIQAVLAEGSSTETNANETAKTGAYCAGALRSSFLICQQKLAGTGALGLAIGLEFGVTPISKIGVRGDRAVRVGSSSSTIASELLQSSCRGDQTRFGNGAQRNLPGDVEALLDRDGFVSNLTYDDVDVCLSRAVPAAPAYARAHAPRSARPKAHFKL